MKERFLLPLLFSLMLFSSKAQQVLVFYTIQTDSNGNLIPWYNPDPGISYDHCLGLIWNFWNNIPSNNGVKFYMTDHSYSDPSSANMVGGDQFGMALSSEALYYAYTGDTAVVENMVYIANSYLENSLSPANALWPNIPFPCNAGNPAYPIYDGDFLLGTGYTQPDKAGSFGEELVNLFKITRDSTYLQKAIAIGNTLAANVSAGDSANSPYPFKIYAQTGASDRLPASFNYTGDVVPTLRLFEDLSALGVGNPLLYDSAYNIIRTWVQTYPQVDNQWGCFFEDIGVPSNTETNAVTMAWYILEHPNWSNTWQQDARSILDWTFTTFEDTEWNAYGATAIYEQTADMKPGGSHTSRYASTELVYSQKTGDTSRVAEAIRQLNWATYLVDTNGQCRFSPDEGSVWYTDGYGDYVRHFMRAMGAYPAIAPAGANHLVNSTSVVSYINYQPWEINYTTFDSSSLETLRLTSKPAQVTGDGASLNELSSLSGEGWVWTPYDSGGVLNIMHNSSVNINILMNTSAVLSPDKFPMELQLYPNPAANSVIVAYTSASGQNIAIELYDLAGHRLKVIPSFAFAGANKTELDISDMPAGSYFLHFTASEGQCFRKLIITR